MDNPTISYWQLPPHADVADLQSKNLPHEVDVTIIGAGISGTAVARWLLHEGSQSAPLRIAIVEARQSCSGATGRNAGHIRPNPWTDYATDKPAIGADDAVRILNVKARHFSEYLKAVDEELDVAGKDAAEVREVDSIDAWFTKESYNEALAQLEVLRQEVPAIGKKWHAWAGDEARNKTLMPDVVGIFANTPQSGGSMWPYRFVTHLQAALLKKYPSLSLDTNTPVFNITSETIDGKQCLNVETSRGVIRTRHVVHAAGSWTSHLVPGLDTHISQERWEMSAQAVGDGIPDAGHWPALFGNHSARGGRAMGLWRDYYGSLLQLPKSGIFIAGGGVAGQESIIPGWDDHTPTTAVVSSYLNGFLPTFFGYKNWGAEKPATPPLANSYPGRSKGIWGGSDAISWDRYPIIGRLPPSTTGREAGAGAEWICAAYSGDGMPSAFLAAKGLSTAILNAENMRVNETFPDWFPRAWIVSAERLSRPGVNNSIPVKAR